MKKMQDYDQNDLDAIEQWWIQKSRKNFFAYRQYMRCGNFKYNWFIAELSLAFQQFYIDYKKGKRPILIISCPPQHGKSWTAEDAIQFFAGLDPNLRMIFASFSESLGVRCNTACQRVMTSEKYNKIFPNTNINKKNVVTVANTYKKNSSQIEFIDKIGSFRNTTVGGPITGETLDIGFIDDPFKGRKEANSKLIRNNVWSWFTDDFGTRFDDKAGYIITMTRWHIDDMVGRVIKKLKGRDNLTIFKFPAIAEKDEPKRKKGEALFPELKSLEFLLQKKETMLEASWDSLYQGEPKEDGGNLIKTHYWQWWERLPKMEYTFAVGDTAQKANNWNDPTVFQFWGMGEDGRIYLLDMMRDRIEAPELRKQAEIFYHKHNLLSLQLYGGVFRGFCIEDKSSGIGLIQELKKKQLKVFAIPRTTDKVTRTYDAGPEIKAGKVVLNTEVPFVSYITDEAKIFPNGDHDDAWDCTMNAIEVAYIYPGILNDTIFVG